MRRKNKTRETLTGAGMIVALLISIPVFFFGCFKLFSYADCQTALNGLDFYERCKADPDCVLTANEEKMQGAYIRLKIKNCPRDE